MPIVRHRSAVLLSLLACLCLIGCGSSDGANQESTNTTTWAKPALVVSASEGPAGHRLAVNSSGDIFLGWLRCRPDNCAYEAMVNRYHGGAWTSPVVLGQADWLFGSQVAAGGTDSAVSVWSGVTEILATFFSDAVGWTTPTPIDDGPVALDPQVAMDAEGNALVAWRWCEAVCTDTSVFQIWANYYRTGIGWLGATAVGPAIGWAGSHRVALDETGHGAVIWTQCETTRDLVNQCVFRVWSARYAPEKGWEAPASIQSDAPGVYAYEPRILFDRTGNAVAFWNQWDHTTRQFSIWSNRYTLDRGWSAPEVVVPDFLNFTWVDWQVAGDRDGQAVVVWVAWNAATTHWEIRTTRYGAQEGWGAPITIQDVCDLSCGDLALAVNGVGDAVAVWRQDPGDTADIWAARYRRDSGWERAALIENNPDAARYPTVVINAHGSAVVVWSQSGLWYTHFD